MSIIELERPAVPAPSARPVPGNVLLTGLRVALLVVLAVAAVAALPSTRATASTPGRFLDDLNAGRVTSVRFVASSGEVRWSEGRFTWYRTAVDEPLPSLPGSADAVTGTDTSEYGPGQTWVERSLVATGHGRLDYQIIDRHDRLSWASQLPWQGLSAAAGGAALGGFLLMLINGGGRFGSRWAWFWVMAFTSGLGVVLFLVLEPSPLWQRRGRQRPLPARPAFLGGAGLVIAVLLKPAIAVLSLLVTT